MHRKSAGLGTILAVSLTIGGLVAVGCGSTVGEGEDGSSGGASSGGSSGFQIDNDPDGGDLEPPCVGLECQQVKCEGGGTTSLSGKVYDPTGTMPLYNAIVYIPNAPVEPFKDGVVCDQCGVVSGSPVTSAITDARGAFKLENVPVGVDLPLVVQLGRWRREVKLPAAKKCADTTLDATTTRLPRNKAEGSIPKIAITTGGADSLECFLRRLGIDDEEFTTPESDGRVHLYRGVSGSSMAGTPNSETLWDDLDELKKYDMVILSCEGDEYPNGSGGRSRKTTGARENMRDYLDAGGRVFSSHFHYSWFKHGAAPLPMTANWVNDNAANYVDGTMLVNTSFPKGQAFSEWLVEVGASDAARPGEVAAKDLRKNVTTVPNDNASSADISRSWLAYNNDTKFFSFNTPVGLAADKQCGRGVYTDIHVSGSIRTNGTFPGVCGDKDKEMTPQEKALLFLLMDLASCIQDDDKPPPAPPSGPGVK